MIKLRNITNKLYSIDIPFAEHNFGPLRRMLILIFLMNEAVKNNMYSVIFKLLSLKCDF